MGAGQLALGAVFDGIGPYPMRVLAFDQKVVMYDVWWPHDSQWALAKLPTRACSYYRLPRDYWDEHARYVRTDSLTERELQVHQPHLPFAFAQRSDRCWYEPWTDVCAASNAGSAVTPVLEAPAIYLEPFNPRNSMKPGVLVHADNGLFFTEPELLKKAWAIQCEFVGDVRLTTGVGVYRSGIQKRLPSYYLWGDRSRLDAPALSVAHHARTSPIS